MKKISVPLMLESLIQYDLNAYVAQLKALNADEVLICFDDYASDPFADLEKSLLELKKISFDLQNNGFSVAVWINTLDAMHKQEYTYLTDVNGFPVNTWNCPLNEAFVSDYCDFIKKIAGTGVKKIVLEDDFRMQIGPEPMCFCDEHMKFYSSYLGYPVTREDMRTHLFDEGANEYRRAWIAGCREALEQYARRIRAAVDEVDPSIGFRLCCGPSLFGGDGTDPITLIDILEGKSGIREMRLIGAPYWRLFGESIASPMDFERRQAMEYQKQNVLLYVEGDPYPRPRFTNSAYRLEFYHTVAIADCNFDGIMKYAIDYMSDANYEIGYVKKSKFHTSLYETIETMFSDKDCSGVYLYEPFDFVTKAVYMPHSPEGRVVHSAGRHFFNDISIPIAYKPNCVNAVFGENARNFDLNLLENGTVLDIRAAMIFRERGVDVGIRSFNEVIPGETGHGLNAYYEEYFEEQDKVALYAKPAVCFNLQLTDSAQQLTQVHFVDVTVCGCYLFENSSGQRFFVYNFDADTAVNIAGWTRSYHRQRQFARAYEWLCGKPLPAFCPGNPDLYLMTKTNANAMAIGLWNNFEDETMQNEIYLGKPYKNVQFVGCKGVLDGSKVILENSIPAFSFAFILLTDQ